MSTNTEEESTELIGDIQNLQNIELDLFDSLEKGLANNTLTENDKKTIINQISNISSMRVNLFNSLNNINSYYQGTVSSTGDVIQNQINALNVIENELNETNTRLKIIEDEKNNKQRMVEINTYYGEKYADQTNIMKTVVYFCIPIILLTILANTGFLPRVIFNILFVILIVSALIVIGMKLIYLLSHDNMNYQEYVWGDAPSSKNTVIVENDNNNGSNPFYSIDATCTGQECCNDGFTYIPSPTNKCVDNTNLPTGVNPYDPNQSISVSSSTDTISGVTSNLTSAATGIANTASQSVASVYSSLSTL